MRRLALDDVYGRGLAPGILFRRHRQVHRAPHAGLSLVGPVPAGEPVGVRKRQPDVFDGVVITAVEYQRATTIRVSPNLAKWSRHLGHRFPPCSSVEGPRLGGRARLPRVSHIFNLMEAMLSDSVGGRLGGV